MSKEGVAKLQAYLDTGDYLVHGSPIPGLTVLKPGKHPRVRSRSPEGEWLDIPEAVHATSVLDVAVFVGAIWSKDGLSGYFTLRHPTRGVHHRCHAAPQVIRNASRREATGYVVKRKLLKPRPEMPAAYMTTNEVPVFDAAPISLFDLATPLLVGAEVERPPDDCEPLPNFADLPPAEQALFSYKWVLERPDDPRMSVPGHDYRRLMADVRIMDPTHAHHGY